MIVFNHRVSPTKQRQLLKKAAVDPMSWVLAGALVLAMLGGVGSWWHAYDQRKKLNEALKRLQKDWRFETLSEELGKLDAEHRKALVQVWEYHKDLEAQQKKQQLSQGIARSILSYLVTPATQAGQSGSSSSVWTNPRYTEFLTTPLYTGLFGAGAGTIMEALRKQGNPVRGALLGTLLGIIVGALAKAWLSRYGLGSRSSTASSLSGAGQSTTTNPQRSGAGQSTTNPQRSGAGQSTTAPQRSGAGQSTKGPRSIPLPPKPSIPSTAPPKRKADSYKTVPDVGGVLSSVRNALTEGLNIPPELVGAMKRPDVRARALSGALNMLGTATMDTYRAMRYPKADSRGKTVQAPFVWILSDKEQRIPENSFRENY